MIEAEASDTTLTDGPDPEPEVTDGGDGEEGPPIASGALGPLRPDAGRLEDRHAAAQPIPQKWRRHILRLDPVTLAKTDPAARLRSEEHTSALQSLMLTSYAVFCLNKKKYDSRPSKIRYKHHTPISSP